MSPPPLQPVKNQTDIRLPLVHSRSHPPNDLCGNIDSAANGDDIIIIGKQQSIAKLFFVSLVHVVVDLSANQSFNHRVIII
jgi:hypothetical protein